MCVYIIKICVHALSNVMGWIAELEDNHFNFSVSHWQVMTGTVSFHNANMKFWVEKFQKYMENMGRRQADLDEFETSLLT